MYKERERESVSGVNKANSASIISSRSVCVMSALGVSGEENTREYWVPTLQSWRVPRGSGLDYAEMTMRAIRLK